MEEKFTAEMTCIRMPSDVKARLTDEALRQRTTLSNLVRQYCEKGLDINGYENNITKIAEITEQSVEKVLEPFMKRLIALIQKNGKIEAGGYFLLLHMIMTEKGTSGDLLEIVEACNKLAVGYIKQQNSNIEEYLGNSKDLTEKAIGLNKRLFYLDD